MANKTFAKQFEEEMRLAVSGCEELRTVDEGKLRELSLVSSSKGNQRKWYNDSKNTYIKEQFFYQGKYWDDWKVEMLSCELTRNLDVGVSVLKQEAVKLASGTYAVESYDFCKDGYTFVTYYRILKKAGLEFEEYVFPMDRFNSIVDTVQDKCNLDISNYLVVMCVLDYILLNEDRHLNNIGVLEKNGKYTLAPLFDFGLGLFEHDRRYENKTYDAAVNRIAGKPFCEDMFSILNSIYRSKYKDVLVSIIKSISWSSLDRWIPNTLAKTHLDRAESSLKELVS